MVLGEGPDLRFLESDSLLGLIVMLDTVLGTLWMLITLPFRLVIWLVEMLGRLTGLVLGFVLMVIGMALMAGPFFIIGIPLFIIGLLLTLRSLG